APEMVLPVFVAVVLFFALLISYPWVVLTIGTVCFLASLPLGYLSYRKHERKDAAGASVTPLATRAGVHAPAQSEAPSPSPGHPEPPADPSRPARINGAGEGVHERAHPSLPGLIRQSISFASSLLRSRWTRGSSPRVTLWVSGPAADAPASGRRDASNPAAL